MKYVDTCGFNNIDKANFECCNGCEDRYEGCHDRCPSYIARFLDREEERKEIFENSENRVHAYFHKTHSKEAGVKKSRLASNRKSKKKNNR